MAQQLEIRNSAAEFLTSVIEGRRKTEFRWTQKAKLPDFDLNV